jgi:hypothetical protein
MEWLASNWVWILVGIGLIWFMSRGHAGMGCCGGGHSHGTGKEDPEKTPGEKPVSTKGGCH